jgi:hypothetical protein
VGIVRCPLVLSQRYAQLPGSQSRTLLVNYYSTKHEYAHHGRKQPHHIHNGSFH